MSYAIGTIEQYDRAANRAMDALLQSEGIRRDAHLEYSCGVFDDGELIATGSFFGSTLRCFAVRADHRGEGLLGQLISYLVQEELERGRTELFVYTTPTSAPQFRSLGFYTIAEVPGKAVFLENRRDGFLRFCSALERAPGTKQAAVVMNADPFTLGHLHLIRIAAAENDVLHVFVLSEDRGCFPASVREDLVRRGAAGLPNVIVHRTDSYLISSATFPSYFFREEADVIEGHAALDAAVFSVIANHLGIRCRYVGEEPTSLVTGIYNRILTQVLPQHGIACSVIPRFSVDGTAVSAGKVRLALRDRQMDAVRSMVPDCTWEYLCSSAAESVLNTISERSNVLHY